MANLEQSRSWVLDVWFVKLTLLLIIAFYITKAEKLSSCTIALSNGTVFAKNMLTFCENNDGKIEGVLVVKGIFSETTFVCVHTYQISSFWRNSNEF